MQNMTWEREYRNPQLVTKGEEPQKDTLRFLKWLKKEQNVVLENLAVLDLGCGTGRNSNYIASLDNKVTGFEISTTALELARSRGKGISVNYQHQNIGAAYPLADNSIDLILDVTSSNSLNEKEREIYLSEAARVLKPGGCFFVKTLCKDGDQNAKNLIKKNPGPEADTYINTDMGLVERVFTEKDFRDLYTKDFQILYLEKKTSYTRFKNQSYKRNFWLAYLQKI
ncbi:MAG: class I SAM-dependent methyltransferase [Candidatus Parcubacteria bacterium]|nr:class I SAM-dependent methyltransferase [Candidatus Parcubacteria bacterium]